MNGDRRGLVHMSADMLYVHNRLEQWGRWAKDFSSLGYPTRSITEKFGEGGILAGSPRPPTDMSQEVAYTDTAVARLDAMDKNVIRTYYTVWAPPETLWKQCLGIRSFSNFKAVLTRARWRVSATLEALES